MHCWICDPEARNMTNDVRSAVTSFCSIPGVGNEMSGKVTLQTPLHPNLRKSYEFLLPFFEQIVVFEQNLLSDPKHQENFLKYLSHDLREQVRSKWAKMGGDGAKMWDLWQKTYTEWKHEGANSKFRKVSNQTPI